ncbi:MAG: 50S ribosomal protein L11 methyltransferase [Desmonostoc vinosum HA7617-LM4]|jgi:ribosomal protein L11 methyltransferase|nr:50S ribosomal protein L11 methyltransferase [Desmonostoc vinosum HA7617-LM4]
MPWMELSLNTTHEGVDWVYTLIAQTINIGDVQIREYAKLNQSSLDEQDWAFTMSLYLACDVHLHTRTEKIVNLLLPLHRTGLATAIRQSFIEEKPKDTDVINPFIHRIGRFVILSPSLPDQSQAAEEVILRLNKTLCFGSGLHPTTATCLKLIERYISPGMNVLDLGSGSGILSVAMAKLGANVLALDNDMIAVQATQDTVRLNGVEQQVSVMAGSLGAGSDLGHWMNKDITDNIQKIPAKKSFDLITANILPWVSITLADEFQCALRQTDTNPGLLITSGFTVDNEENVATALTQAGFEFVGCERSHEWVALVYRLK